MTTQKAQCVICGYEADFIPPSHLKKHNITTAEYKIKYPTNPLVSAAFRAAAAERNKAANELRKGTKRTPEEKAKMSATKKARYASGETVAWNKGVPRTDEQKLHQSMVAKQQFTNGRVHHMQGKHHTEETKSKIATHFTGRTLPQSTIDKKPLRCSRKRLMGGCTPKVLIFLLIFKLN